MAVKFSQFTPETAAANVTDIVGYQTSGNLNIKIPPANLDTLVSSATAASGTGVTYTLTGTKAGTANTTDVTTFTVPATSGLTLTSGTKTIELDATSYKLTSTDTGSPGTVPIVLTGTGGGDPGTETVNLIGAGTVAIGSTGNTITITGAGGSGTVTSVGMAVPAAFAVTPASITASGTFTISGAGNATQVVLGNGALGTLPTDTNTTYTVDVPTGTTSINLKGSDATDDAIVLVGGNDIGLVRDSANQITINSQAVGGVTSVDETTPGTSSGTPIVVNPTTGTVLVQSMAYAGQANVGHVPTGGVAGQYLDGDTGAWITLPSTLSIDKKTFTGTGSQTVFNLASTAAGLTVNNLAIYISGVYQNKLDASDVANFTVGAGANPDVTFSPAPPLTAANGIEIVITR